MLTVDPLHAAHKLHEEVSALGFDWPDTDGVLAKVREEIDEVEAALGEGNIDHARSELGDLLFTVVNLSRFLSVDPAEALSRCCERFSRRFALLRSHLEAQGKRIEECSLDELDLVWKEVKKKGS